MSKRYRRRNSLRHPSHDYTTPGAYYVTVCADRGRCVFGRIENHTMILSPLGELANARCKEVLEAHTGVKVDCFVVMPNHVHILLWLGSDPELPPTASHGAVRKFGSSIAGSLSTLIGAYKSSVTQRAKHRGLWPDASLWQDDFYDHIVRNAEDLQRIRDYIGANPLRWREDQLHPEAPPNKFNQSWKS